MYRAVLLRGVPSIVHLELTPKKYLPWTRRSTTSLVTYGPVYSMIRLPFGMGPKVNKPNPYSVFLMANLYFPLVIVDISFFKNFTPWFTKIGTERIHSVPIAEPLKSGGADGTRTRDLRRDRPAF